MAKKHQLLTLMAVGSLLAVAAGSFASLIRRRRDDKPSDDFDDFEEFNDFDELDEAAAAQSENGNENEQSDTFESWANVDEPGGE